jgi:hypothetical protein
MRIELPGRRPWVAVLGAGSCVIFVRDGRCSMWMSSRMRCQGSGGKRLTATRAKKTRTEISEMRQAIALILVNSEGGTLDIFMKEWTYEETEGLPTRETCLVWVRQLFWSANDTIRGWSAGRWKVSTGEAEIAGNITPLIGLKLLKLGGLLPAAIFTWTCVKAVKDRATFVYALCCQRS